jgi:hypothetical protein
LHAIIAPINIIIRRYFTEQIWQDLQPRHMVLFSYVEIATVRLDFPRLDVGGAAWEIRPNNFRRFNPDEKSSSG